MLFLAGIDKLTLEEKRVLLAQLESINSLEIIKDQAASGINKGKNSLAELGAVLAEKINRPDWREKITEWDSNTNMEGSSLQEAIDKSLQDVVRYSEYEVYAYLKEELAELAGLTRANSFEEIGREMILHMARHYKLPAGDDDNTAALEEKLFELCLEEQLEILKKEIDAGNSQELQELLKAELDKLSPEELEAVRKATGLDELSAQALLTFIKTGSSVAIAQLLIAGTGFGAYLFLTTLAKAVSLLLGVTFSFGTYTALTSTLAFLLSPMFLLFVILGSGGVLWWKTSGQLDDYLIKMVFLMGKARLMKELP